MSKDKIKQAALKHFAEKGYDGTSLSAIAGDVGIKKPSIYSHFAGKEAVFLALCDDVFSKSVADFKQTIQKETSVRNQLYVIFQYVCDSFVNDYYTTTFWKRITLFPPAHLEAEIRKKFHHYERELSHDVKPLFQRGIDEGTLKPHRPEELLAAFYCLLDGVFVEFYYYGPDTFRERNKAAWKVFWEGIQNDRKEEA